MKSTERAILELIAVAQYFTDDRWNADDLNRVRELAVELRPVLAAHRRKVLAEAAERVSA